MKTQQHTCTPSYSRLTSICFDKICYSPWHWIVKFFQDLRCHTIPCFTYSLPHLFFTQYSVSNLFFHYIPYVLYGIHIFPGYSRMRLLLIISNVLVLFELCSAARSCIMIYPFCGNTTHSYVISISWIISLVFLHYPCYHSLFSEETGICC